MSLDGLPAPTSNARHVALTSSAVVSDVLSLFLVPGATIFHQAFSNLIERRLQRAQNIVLEAVEKGDIHLLSDPELEFAIPTTFRFFQAARNGEAAHNLRIMADIIAGRIRTKRLDPADFLQTARQLEGLRISDLAALVAVHEMDGPFRSRHEGVGDWREQKLASTLIPSYFASKVELGSSLALLAGRGLIVPDQQTTLDASLQAYLSSPFLAEIVERLKEELAASASASHPTSDA